MDVSLPGDISTAILAAMVLDKPLVVYADKGSKLFEELPRLFADIVWVNCYTRTSKKLNLTKTSLHMKEKWSYYARYFCPENHLKVCENPEDKLTTVVLHDFIVEAYRVKTLCKSRGKKTGPLLLTELTGTWDKLYRAHLPVTDLSRVIAAATHSDVVKDHHVQKALSFIL